MITGCQGSDITFWDLRTGRQAQHIAEAHGMEDISCMTMDSLGRCLLTGDRSGNVQVRLSVKNVLVRKKLNLCPFCSLWKDEGKKGVWWTYLAWWFFFNFVWKGKRYFWSTLMYIDWLILFHFLILLIAFIICWKVLSWAQTFNEIWLGLHSIDACQHVLLYHLTHFVIISPLLEARNKDYKGH